MYKVCEKIGENTNISVDKIFIFFNIVCWLIGMSIISLFLFYVEVISITTMFMFIGYPVVFFGFFGSALYVYRRQ